MSLTSTLRVNRTTVLRPTTATLRLRASMSTSSEIPTFGFHERQPTTEEKQLIDDVLELCERDFSCIMHTPHPRFPVYGTDTPYETAEDFTFASEEYLELMPWVRRQAQPRFVRICTIRRTSQIPRPHRNRTGPELGRKLSNLPRFVLLPLIWRVESAI